MPPLEPPHRWFSKGSDALLGWLTPYSGAGEASFPRTADLASVRWTQGQNAHQWFVQCVDAVCGGDTDQCLVEDDLAVLAALKWSRGRLLEFASVQVLKVECSLHDFYSGAPSRHYYLRLDLDERSLGTLFSHPFPHIHADPEGPLRFSLENGTSANVVVDFVEFAYLQFYPEKWMAWAERVWNTEFRETHSDAEDNPFRAIRKAFAESRIEIIREQSGAILELKRALQLAKEGLLGLRMSTEDLRLLAYP